MIEEQEYIFPAIQVKKIWAICKRNVIWNNAIYRRNTDS